MPDINDLPRYSPWPSRLLGLKPFRQVNRNAKELIREFETEKWGGLLNKVKEFGPEKILLPKVEEWQYSQNQEVLGWIQGEWKVTSASNLREYYLEWVAQQLNPWLDCDAIAELGAGYGSIILNLTKRGLFERAELYAGEFTQSGLQLISLLAEREGININRGYCDFTPPMVLDIEIPAGALIYTIYSAHYIPMIEYNFVETLTQQNPSIVVHIEPLYEHCLDNDLLNLMRRRYIEVNDYNRNLLTLLRECEDRGEVEIVHEASPGFGSNPLFAASVVAWRPTKK